MWGGVEPSDAFGGAYRDPETNTKARVMSQVRCAQCGNYIVPYVITGSPIPPGRAWTPIPLRSVCRFCGSTYASFYSPVKDLLGRLLRLVFVLMFPFVVLRLLIALHVIGDSHGAPAGSSSGRQPTASTVPRKR